LGKYEEELNPCGMVFVNYTSRLPELDSPDAFPLINLEVGTSLKIHLPYMLFLTSFKGALLSKDLFLLGFGKSWFHHFYSLAGR